MKGSFCPIVAVLGVLAGGNGLAAQVSLRPEGTNMLAGTTIPADGYLLVWADEDTTDTPGLHASFKLAKSGEEVFLTDTDANLNAMLDHVSFGTQQTDVSYGRSANDADVWEVMMSGFWIPLQPVPNDWKAACFQLTLRSIVSVIAPIQKDAPYAPSRCSSILCFPGLLRGRSGFWGGDDSPMGLQ